MSRTSVIQLSVDQKQVLLLQLLILLLLLLLLCDAATWQRRFPHVRRFCMNTAAVRNSACWKYDCVLACGFWSTKVHVVFLFAEPSWNISPGKPASCSSLARLLAAAMFHVSYMFSQEWPSLQSWSAAGAMVASLVEVHWYHSPVGVVCETWTWEVQAPPLLRRSTPTYSRRPSISWSTTWHRLAAVCWMICDVCLRCRSDVDWVWRR